MWGQLLFYTLTTTKMKILSIVDDDEIFRFTTEMSIKRIHTNLQILSFEDGEAAIDYFDSHADESEKLPDVIFLDINMPYLDGWGFLDEFKKRNNNIDKKILIFMSSSSMADEDINKAKSYEEVKGYIIKPITNDVFDKIVKNIESINEFVLRHS